MADAQHPNLGARALKTVLEQRGLKQKEAAALAQLDEGKLSRLLNEKALPNRGEAVRIRTAFAVDPALWDEAAEQGAA